MNQFFQVHQILINNIALGLFVLSLVFLALLVIGFRKVKPAESGECLNCRYPLTGLDAQTETCPECGKKLTPADWAPPVHWRQKRVVILLMRPYVLWACFAFCFVGSVFLGMKVMPSVKWHVHPVYVPLSNLVNPPLPNTPPHQITIIAAHRFKGLDLTFGNWPIMERIELVPGIGEWVAFFPSASTSQVLIFLVEPETMHFGFKDLPNTFKDAPGLIESRTLPQIASDKFQRLEYPHAVPVNLENVERVITQWEMNKSLRASPTTAEIQQMLQELHNVSGWLKSSQPPDVQWYLFSFNNNHGHGDAPRVTTWTWLSSRAWPSVIAGFLTALLLIWVRHKKRKLESLGRAKPVESIESI